MLGFAAWVVNLALIQAGLKEVRTLQQQVRDGKMHGDARLRSVCRVVETLRDARTKPGGTSDRLHQTCCSLQGGSIKGSACLCARPPFHFFYKPLGGRDQSSLGLLDSASQDEDHIRSVERP